MQICENAIAAYWDNAAPEIQERIGVAAGYKVWKLWRSEWFIGGWYGNPHLGNGILPYRIPPDTRLRLRPHIVRALRDGIETLPIARKRK